MSRDTIDVGIELGRTESRIAIWIPTGPEIVRNDMGMDCTPSAVWIRRSGEFYIGMRAAQRAQVEPDDVHHDFVARIGVPGGAATFAASGRSLTFPELAAEVLKALKADPGRTEPVTAAVITVPAGADRSRREATSRAAELAGLPGSPLIEEPVAAAHAFRQGRTVDDAFWLVYDLGARSFDATVVGVRPGWCTAVGRAGHEGVGSEQFDWDVVDRILMPAAQREFGWAGFRRGPDMDQRWRTNVTMLRSAAESARTGLYVRSRVDSFLNLRDATGELVGFEFELTRADQDRLLAPHLRRSVLSCREALDEAGLDPRAIERVLLVGDATRIPGLRDLLVDPVDGLGIALDHSVDPGTAVVRGAAVFAGRQLMPANPPSAPRGIAAPRTADVPTPEVDRPRWGEAMMNARIVDLLDDIQEDAANRIMAELLVLESRDPHADIELYINSNGGSYVHGRAVQDTMDFLRCDVATSALGQAAGMAAVLLMAGARGKRHAVTHARVAFAPLTASGAPVEDVARIHRDLAELMARYTGQSVARVALDMAASRVFTATEAREYGIVDHVIPARSQPPGRDHDGR